MKKGTLTGNVCYTNQRMAGTPGGADVRWTARKEEDCIMRGIQKRLLVGVMILALGLTALMVPSVDVSAWQTSADWMAEVDGETMLSSLSIPGTHDTCTQYVGMSYIFQCQDTSVSEQLENGYRYLDLRLVIEEKDEEQTLVIKHNFSNCKTGRWPWSKHLYLEDVLEDVYEFLEEHPTETVILCMKAENSEDDVAQVQELLYQQIEQQEQQWYLANEIPMLEDVRGKIVLATRFEDKMGVGEDRAGLCFGWTDQGDKTVVDVPYALSMINDTSALWVQDRYNYDTADKLDAIVDDLENCQAADDTFSLNFTSTSGSGSIGHPKKYASAINAYLLDYDWQQGTCYGIVIVDFATEELAQCIYQTNDTN